MAPCGFPELQENGGAQRRQIFTTFPGINSTPSHKVSSLRSPSVRSYWVQTEVMFEQKWEKKSCNLQTFTKARVFKQFQSLFLCGLVGKRLNYKTAISDFQNFGFAKKLFQIVAFLKILIFFFVFKKFQKTGIHVSEHYIVHGHTKFQAALIFGSHFITLKRCCPSDRSMVPNHWGLDFGITTSSMSFYALPFLCVLVEKRWVYKTAISDFQFFYFLTFYFLDTFWIFKTPTNLCT